ncbi:hypothetical protein MTO96_000785 [Rhipicephalus appendiculatus]
MSPIKFLPITQRVCSPLLSLQNSPLLLPGRYQHTHPLAAKVFSVFRVYEDVVGLTEVKAAQTKVLEAEQKFVATQEQQLDKTHRGEDRYLTLITQEHAVIKEERALLEQFKHLEKAERDYFAALSLALRESHEKERAQGERTKYWSIIGSVCGAVIGIIGATINNRIRLNQLRDLVERSSSQPEVQRFGLQPLGRVQAALEEAEGDVRRAAVYIGEDVRDIVADSQRQLEWKMKINSLAMVALVYGALAVTVPLLAAFFKGS